MSSDYGWEVNSLITQASSRDRYIHLVDHFMTPGDGNGFPQTFDYPAWKNCTVHVITSNVRIWDHGLEIQITYPSGVPTVYVKTTVAQSMNVWVIATYVNPDSDVVPHSDYGIELFDAVGGSVYVPDGNMLHFLERYSGQSTWYNTVNSDYKGWVEVETYTNTPPICFWRPKHTGHVYQPVTLTAMRSPDQASVRNFRWVVGCEYVPTGTGVTDGGEYYVYVFDVYIPKVVVNYGIEIKSTTTSNNLVLGNGAPLVLNQIVDHTDFNVNSNNNSILECGAFQYAGYKATSIMPQMVKQFTIDGNTETHFVRFTNPYDGISGQHGRGNFANPDPALVTPQWYIDHMQDMGLILAVIDTSQYDAVIKIENLE